MWGKEKKEPGGKLNRVRKKYYQIRWPWPNL